MVIPPECGYVAFIVKVYAEVIAEWDDAGTFHTLQHIHAGGLVIDADEVEIGPSIVWVITHAVAVLFNGILEHEVLLFQNPSFFFCDGTRNVGDGLFFTLDVVSKIVNTVVWSLSMKTTFHVSFVGCQIILPPMSSTL